MCRKVCDSICTLSPSKELGTAMKTKIFCLLQELISNWTSSPMIYRLDRQTESLWYFAFAYFSLKRLLKVVGGCPDYTTIPVIERNNMALSFSLDMNMFQFKLNQISKGISKPSKEAHPAQTGKGEA